MSEFSRKPGKFLSTGINLVKPVDLLDPSEYTILTNLRQYQAGVLESRPGTTVVNSTDGGGIASFHSIRELNDDIQGTTTYIIGAGTTVRTVATGGGVSTQRDTGYSGNPLSMIPFRPARSAEPWLYIVDSSQMRKIRQDGTNYAVGIAPPATPPTVILGTPAEQVIDEFLAVGAWANSGDAGAIAASTTDRVNDTVRVTAGSLIYVLYDNAPTNTGWCSFALTAVNVTALAAGARVTIGGAGPVTIYSCIPGFPATTIAAISYDAGTTGDCTIVLTSAPGILLSGGASGTLPPGAVLMQPTPFTPSGDLAIQPGMILKLGGGTAETVLVKSVTVGPDGSFSLRTSTATNHVAGNTAEGLQTFRVFLTGVASGQAVIAGDFSFTVTFSSGTGAIAKTGLTLNLGVTNSGVTRTLEADDEFHLSFQVDDPSKMTEARILFNVDPTDTTFVKNYYVSAVRPSDLTPALGGANSLLAAAQQAITNLQLDRYGNTITDTTPLTDYLNYLVMLPENPDMPNPVYGNPVDTLQSQIDFITSQQLEPGQTQWNEIRFKLGSMNRVGTDSTRTLKDCTGIKIWFRCTATIAVKVSALFVKGGFGPDIMNGADLFYRYRYRSSATGAKSNASPPLRSGLRPHRQRVTPSATASGDTQVDRIDWFRWGGALTSWHYVGSTANATGAYNDDVADADIANGEILDFRDFQPFPVVDIPRTGTANIIGTTMDRTGGTDNFNTSWAPGTLIAINTSTVYTIYRVLSTTKLEIIENGGNQAGVTWTVNQPLLLGQPLAAAWGPFGEGETALFNFAVGDLKNSGRLYWTKGNDADSSPEDAWTDITSPSEPLMNGVMWNNNSWVFSTERAWRLIPSFITTAQFLAYQIPVARGLYARWGICAGPDGIYYIGKDGIYKTNGGVEVSITDEKLYPLFPHEGQAGVASGGYQPPNMTLQANLRLSHADGYIYFDYQDTGGTQRNLVYDTRTKGWYSDSFAALGTVIAHYGAEGRGIHQTVLAGSNTGGSGRAFLFSSAVTADSGAAVSYQVRTGSFDMGDSRANKVFGDVMIDAAPNSTAITPIIGLNNYSSTVTPSPSTFGAASAARTQFLFDLSAGVGSSARNIALNLAWSGTARVQLYEWQPSFVLKPEATALRGTDWTDDGYNGAKWLQGCVIEADTSNVARTVQVQGDNGTVIATLSVTHNGQVEMPYSWVGAYTHEMRLVPTDANTWSLFKVKWAWIPAPELTTTWEGPDLTLGNRAFWHVPEIYIGALNSAALTLTVTIDGVASTYTVPAGGASEVKQRIKLAASKGMVYRFKLTSAGGFRLMLQDCEVRAKSWGDSGAYQILRPFGDISSPPGAEARI